MLSATFLSAETMASPGTRGLSTYLGFLIGPAVRARERHRGGARERQGEGGGERERERERK